MINQQTAKILMTATKDLVTAIELGISTETLVETSVKHPEMGILSRARIAVAECEKQVKFHNIRGR